VTKVTGKLILITGASRGIGAATAIALAHRGARVLLLARTQNALEKLAQQISAQGGEARVYPTNLSEPEAVDHVAKIIKQEMGIPDVIINNAATGKWLFTEETAPTEMVEMMALPYFAAFHVTRSFLPEMLKRKSGHIVNVTSAAAYRALPGATAYNAACWAIRGFTEALRADLYGTGVQVTLLVSGTATTPGFAHYPGVEERMPAIVKLVPLLTPEQVALAMVQGIERNQHVVVIPFMVRLLVVLDRLLPRFTEWLVVSTGWKHTR
jgi:uncharacterized protein